MTQPDIIEFKTTLIEDPSEGLVVKKAQVIPQRFLDDLKDEREASLHTPAGDFHRVARIPEVVVDEMIRAGLDIYRSPIQDILAWLKKRELEAFLASKRRV